MARAGARGAGTILGLLVASACSTPESPPGPSLPWPYRPFEPSVPQKPILDERFVQEVNHREDQLGPNVGPLAAVLVPPSASFETPTQVTPRGLVAHSNGAAAVLAIDTADPDLVAAAFAGATLVLAGPSALYLLDGPAGPPTRLAAPKGVTITGIAGGPARAYLLTDHGVGLVMGPAPGTVDWPSNGKPVSAAVAAPSTLVVADASGVSGYALPTALPLGAALFSVGAQDLPKGTVRALVANVTLPEPLDVVAIGDAGLAGIRVTAGAAKVVSEPLFAAGRVPLAAPTSATATADGGFVVGTHGGAYRVIARDLGPDLGPEWRVYGAARWLPGEDVRAVASEPTPDGACYFATDGGAARATMRRVTLAEKLDDFVARVVTRHDRDGAVADSHLTTSGDLSTNIPYDSDNDGGWTSYWLLSECFRYRATGDGAAKAHFDESLARMLSFRTLTGTDWFVARSVIRRQGCKLDDCAQPDDGEWFLSPDGAFWVKGDTSNDEVTSHMFMMGHAYDLCADATQKEAIVAHVRGIVGGLVDHDFDLWDVDRMVTSYGQFGPSYVNDNLAGKYEDGGRRSAQMLAALTLAFYLTGEERFLSAKSALISEHNYADNAVRESEYALRKGSGDGDELAMQAFFVLLRYEADPALRKLWLEGWHRTYGNIRLQQGAWWDVTNAVLGGETVDLSHVRRWLRLAPVDMIRWPQHNSARLDLAKPPAYYHQDGAMRSDGLILPYDERPNDRWNTDQFRLDGGLGAGIEMDGADVLAPYWMGRYYHMIAPAP